MASDGVLAVQSFFSSFPLKVPTPFVARCHERNQAGARKLVLNAIRAPHLRQKAIWQSALKHVGLPRRCISNPYARLLPAIDRGHELPERFAPILLRPERSLQKHLRTDRFAGQRSLIWAHEFRTPRKQDEDLPISLRPGLSRPHTTATALPSFAGSKRNPDSLNAKARR